MCSNALLLARIHACTCSTAESRGDAPVLSFLTNKGSPAARELRLGGRLLERLPDGVRLTALGATVAERARRILREVEAADRAIDAIHAGRTGTFRITASPP